MALSSPVHEAIHSGSHDADHECAATLFASGSVEGPLSIILSAVYLRTDVAESIALPELDVQSIFLAGGVLEHAPPVLSWSSQLSSANGAGTPKLGDDRIGLIPRLL